MTTIYLAHTCVDTPMLGNIQDVQVAAGTVGEILDELNRMYPGLKPRLLDDQDRIRSCAWLTKNVKIEDGRLFIEREQSAEIRQLDELLQPDDNMLVSLFDIGFIGHLLDNGLASTDERFEYENEDGRPNRRRYRGYIQQEYKVEQEDIFDFVSSPLQISQLMYDLTDEMRFEFRAGDATLDRFDRERCRLVPSPLGDAIHSLLTDPAQRETAQVRLRLFQEDALFFVLGKLWAPDSIPERSLLLSMPTGGGKTEAFMFPLVSHLLTRKAESMKQGDLATPSIKALVLYPTKALANDQAKRLAEIVHLVNRSVGLRSNLPSELGITIGIFTGDTPSGRGDLRDGLGNFLSLFQLCPACNHADFDLESRTINAREITVQRCRNCGELMDYCRVTRNDILNAPPDILITNPDTLNFHIQIPNRQAILIQNAEIVIFDEVHEYSGIFGCNVAHLLRRIEALRQGRPPLYVGLSATIGNARNLAALLFNVHPDDVLYIRDSANRPYLDRTRVARRRLHLLLTPNMFARAKRERAYPLTATINTVSALGHAIRDPQFRKILIFSNFKADHDKLSFQIPENERDYVGIYRDYVRGRVRQAVGQGILPVMGSSDRAVMRQVARWYEWEQRTLPAYEPDLEVGWHRGALEMERRVRAVNRFASLNRIRTGDEARGYEYPLDVMVATKTLELGIDIGNVTIVINSSSPFSNNDYVQRTGRGGRRKDGVAITIINPNNAIDAFMREHFQEFVFPHEFEDAPIIASNEVIMAAHVRARILDYLARALGIGNTISVGDWLDHALPDGKCEITVRANPDRYAELLFARIFPGDSFSTFLDWFNVEAELLTSNRDNVQVVPYRVDSEWVINVLRQVCVKLKKMTDPSTPGAWDQTAILAGTYETVFRELHPSLRGAGKSVGLFLRKRNEDEWKDEISRDRAIYQNPPHSFQSQGRNLFVIEEIKRRDEDAEADVTELLVDNPPAYRFFLERFPDSSLQYPPGRAFRWRFRTPDELRVCHYPSRYYCSHESCGLVYTAGEVTDDLKCPECHWDLHQITRVYRCPQCNTLSEPPVPKICINPECIRAKLDKDQHGRVNSSWNLRIAIKTAIRRRDTSVLRGFFRFKSRPNLEWECFDCHQIVSLNRRDAAARLGTPIGQMPSEGDLDGAEAHRVIAWYALYRPELPLWNKREYTRGSFNLNGFDCPDIENCPSHWRGGLRAVNLPRFQTDVVQYHIAQRSLGESRATRLGDLSLFQGDVVSIAERYALSDPRDDENEAVEVTRHRIFDDGALYATKFTPHMIALNLRGLDDFLARVPCTVTRCSECTEIERIELGQIYRPGMHLQPRFLEDGKPIQPDPRAVWCSVNRAGNCPSINCQECEFFEWNALRRFVVLHTLKHGILWALPKYTGLDIGSFKGVVHPGFLSKVAGVPDDVDLLIVDTNDGGSGAVHLINRWWESHIVPTAIEILQLAALPSTDNRRACLNLPYTCSWFNGNLCPVLTGKFIAEL